MAARIVTIPIEQIRSEGLQVRVAMDTDTVADYVAVERDGGELPPVTVYSNQCGEYWLADGFHRVEARRQRGERTIKAEVLVGGNTDALKAALGANRNHGLRRTNADKRRAILMAWENRNVLGLGARPSATLIADLCGVRNRAQYTCRVSDLLMRPR